MPDDTVIAAAVTNASAAAIFAVLAYPTKHASIDGAGWVREALDDAPLSASGQIFRMSMYHANHPDGNCEMANRVQAVDPPHIIAWEPGQEMDDGTIRFGGWIWRFDLAPAEASQTTVTLSYDWSAVPDSLREYIKFPPFRPEHLHNSLTHLAELVTE